MLAYSLRLYDVININKTAIIQDGAYILYSIIPMTHTVKILALTHAQTVNFYTVLVGPGVTAF